MKKLPHGADQIDSHPCGSCRCAPSGTRFLRVKVLNPPGSGKDIAESVKSWKIIEVEKRICYIKEKEQPPTKWFDLIWT